MIVSSFYPILHRAFFYFLYFALPSISCSTCTSICANHHSCSDDLHAHMLRTISYLMPHALNCIVFTTTCAELDRIYGLALAIYLRSTSVFRERPGTDHDLATCLDHNIFQGTNCLYSTSAFPNNVKLIVGMIPHVICCLGLALNGPRAI